MTSADIHDNINTALIVVGILGFMFILAWGATK